VGTWGNYSQLKEWCKNAFYIKVAYTQTFVPAFFMLLDKDKDTIEMYGQSEKKGGIDEMIEVYGT